MNTHLHHNITRMYSENCNRYIQSETHTSNGMAFRIHDFIHLKGHLTSHFDGLYGREIAIETLKEA